MKKFEVKNDMPMMKENEGVVLFYPHVPTNAIKYVSETLSGRWIGQGPKVDLFEAQFKNKFAPTCESLAVSSGTAALHIAYLLAGLKEGDEVICPIFTCTATNIPILYERAKPVFADIDPKTLNICPKSIKSKISPKTKAIVVVHYGGLPCDMEEINKIAADANLIVIEDAAHALGAAYDGVSVGEISDLTMFSFQAIKNLTTGDGGLLTIRDKKKHELAKRLRWFGIDRSSKQKGIWENDIKEVGYKYQMTDISASIGIAGLEEIDDILSKRRFLYEKYVEKLGSLSSVNIIDDFNPRKRHGCWLFTIKVENRIECQRMLRDAGIESGQTHYRNDRYSIFNCSDRFPGMDEIDEKYLILPLHTKMEVEHVEMICRKIECGWM